MNTSDKIKKHSDQMHSDKTLKRKSFKIGSLFMALILVFSACENVYTTFPKDQLLEEDFWKSGSDVKSALMTGYFDLRKLQDELILYGLVRSDIVKPVNTNFMAWQKGIFDSEDAICKWSEWYVLIQDMNVVLKKGAAVQDIDPAFTDDQYNAYMAEAKYMRALAYFYMIRMWKNIPIVTEPSLNDQQDYFPELAERDQVFDLIKADLDFAVQYLPESYEFEDDLELSIAMTRGRVTSGAAYALKSDVHLWLDEFDDCISACNQVLNSPLYEILPEELRWSIFDAQQGNSTESIFELNYDDDFDIEDRRSVSSYKYSIDDWFKSRLYAQPISIIWEIPDTRYYTMTGSSWRQIRKHVGSDEKGTGIINENMNPNWIIHRLPHIIFNKAEAMNRRDGESALDELNAMVYDLEQRSGAPEYEPLEGGIKDVEEQLLQFKLKETAFEGTRWFDLVRIGTRQWNEGFMGEENILVRSMVGIMADQDKIFIKGNLNNPESWYIPIHKNEIIANPNITQNPYYQNN